MPRTLHLTESHVALTRRVVPEDDEATIRRWTRLNDAEIGTAAAQMLSLRPAGPLFVFAYGSLIWAPAFAPVRHLRGRLGGWHRAFCIHLTSWRGTPEAPGLMMALLPGGFCTGLLQEVPEEQETAVVEALVRRETPYAELLEAHAWLNVDTAEGPVRALAFYAPPRQADMLTGLTHAATARMIARACGHAGSNAEYLHRTMAALESHGIRDARLWRLQRLVAAEIEGLGWGRIDPAVEVRNG